MISPTMAFQLLQILPGVVGKLTGKDKDAKILSSILALPGMAAGILGKSSSTGTSTGLGIADSKSVEAFKKNPEGIFGGDLSKGMIGGAFGGKNTLPKSLGGAFQSPVWNAPESIFNPPGEEIPFDWGLF